MTVRDRPVVWFETSGEAHTQEVLELAVRRCREGDIDGFVLASQTGRSAVLAIPLLVTLHLPVVVVTHVPCEADGPGGRFPIGLLRPEYSAHRQAVEKAGFRIVQGTRPLVPLSRALDWEGPTPECLMDATLGLFGQGTKIAVEAAVMATDAGAVQPQTHVLSCAGTWVGLDTALVVKTAYSADFLLTGDVTEYVAKPRHRANRRREWESPSWEGDTSPYRRT
mgnify:CR=1 FL=1